MASGLGVGTTRMIKAGGDTFETVVSSGIARTVWSRSGLDVAIAHERNVDTTRGGADVEVITIEGYELGRGRGRGSHCMPAPLEGDAAF